MNINSNELSTLLRDYTNINIPNILIKIAINYKLIIYNCNKYNYDIDIEIK